MCIIGMYDVSSYPSNGEKYVYGQKEQGNRSWCKTKESWGPFTEVTLRLDVSG